MKEQLNLFQENTFLPALPNHKTTGRKEFDFYESPYWFTTELIRRVPIGGTIIEPCVGSHNIASILKIWGQSSNPQRIEDVITSDIDIQKKADYYLDATREDSWKKFPAFDWAITNPPFKDLAAPIVCNAYKYARIGIAFFLQLSFLESCEDRSLFLDKNPPTGVYVLPRFCFRKGGTGRWTTDNITIALFVWDKRATTQTIKSIPKRAIEGFYKNPDKAIAWEKVEEIIKNLQN